MNDFEEEGEKCVQSIPLERKALLAKEVCEYCKSEVYWVWERASSNTVFKCKRCGYLKEKKITYEMTIPPYEMTLQKVTESYNLCEIESICIEAEEHLVTSYGDKLCKFRVWYHREDITSWGDKFTPLIANQQGWGRNTAVIQIILTSGETLYRLF